MMMFGVVSFLDSLGIERAVLAGYDWGGRAACIVAPLWAHRVRGLVTGGGYNIQSVATAMKPQAPEREHALWYQFHFHSERGRAGLSENRYELCRLLWKLWSPSWPFDEEIYKRTATSFDNPDFVEVVIHSYRHRYGLAPGDPSVEDTERRLAAQPSIGVPAIAPQGRDNGVSGFQVFDHHAQHFTDPYERRVLDGVGHTLPLEAPHPFADAVLTLAER